MPYCRECGAQLTEQAKFCTKCGVPTGNINQEEQSQSQQNQEQSSQAQQGQQHQQPVVQYVKPKIPGRGFGIASMVLGIIGLVYSMYSLNTATEVAKFFGQYYGFAFIIGAIIGILIISVLSILALIFSSSARKRGYRNEVSTSGLVMGIIGVIFYFISVVILIARKISF